MVNRFIVTLGLLFVLAISVWWWFHNQPKKQPEIARNNLQITKIHGDKAENKQELNIFPTENSVEQDYFSSKSNGLPSDEVNSRNKIEVPFKKNYHNQTPMRLWQSWKGKLNQAEFQQIPIIGALLAESLHQYPDSNVYNDIANVLLQSTTPIKDKALLLDLLSEIATPESLTKLIELVKQVDNASLYSLALQAISRVGDSRWGGRFHEELSPVLESAWANPVKSDPAFVDAIGKAIAEVGAPSGVSQLLDTISQSNAGIATNIVGMNSVRGDSVSIESEPVSRTKQETAFSVVPNVSNPAAIEVLNSRLQTEPLGSPAFEVSGSALTTIGTPEAIKKIVVWASTAPPEGARNLNHWLSKVDDVDSLQTILAAQQQASYSPEINAVFNGFMGVSATSIMLPEKINNE